MFRLRRFIITTLIGGFLVLLPIAILVFLFRFIIQILYRILTPLANLISLGVPELVVRLIALAGLILFCFFVGLFIRTQIGKTTFRYLEVTWLEKIPAYSTIRDIIQQFTGTKKAPFRQVVLISIYGTGVLMTGFVTDENESYCTVFVPTAPNPTNGYIFHVPRAQVQFCDVRPEEAMRTVVGMGVGSMYVIDRVMPPTGGPVNVSPAVQNDTQIR